MNMNPKLNDIREIVEADRKHVWHHLIQHKMFETVDPRVIVEGRGMRVWDAAGREYLDAVSGGVWTGLFGLILGGPVGWAAGAAIGAGAGALTAKLVDLGISDEWVDWFREAVRRGTTTVVILAEDLDIRALEDEARRFVGAELVHSTLPVSTIDQLRRALGDS